MMRQKLGPSLIMNIIDIVAARRAETFLRESAFWVHSKRLGLPPSPDRLLYAMEMTYPALPQEARVFRCLETKDLGQEEPFAMDRV